LSGFPVIDVAPLVSGHGDESIPAAAIHRACREDGFFYVSGHGLDPALVARLTETARRFFAQPLETKMQIRMERGGRAWRGYFPVGGELTSGRPDLKEGVYFGSELPPADPRVVRGLPLHGPNLFPVDPPELRTVVLAYMREATRLGHALMRGVGLALGLDRDFFATEWMADPTVLFRLFHYPPAPPDDASWGVGEHTDYGVLTILLQDDVGGLEVRSRGGWVAAPPIPGTFVCNIGDMLDRMTGGLYRSTPHRVRNFSGTDRYSFPFFFDPGFDADIRRLPTAALLEDDRERRWDGASVHAFEGTYGDYLVGKVAKVFPALGRTVLSSPAEGAHATPR
jgi:isopenicillin N synthase-like dioxygenase